MTMVTVRFFAGFRERTGTDRVEIPFEDGMTLTELMKRLGKEFPELKKAWKDGVATVAVNHEVMDGDYPVKEGDEVAIFPPVSGG
ncbi:MAG: molybdopterin converting factor subunit 1 [Methanobacteriota archaeon]|nr:MAG: molybdopterin converting factor subunit 1 [Euryarchaeota archaeon]